LKLSRSRQPFGPADQASAHAVSDDRLRSGWALTLFAVLWAAASLFHVASFDQWADAPLVILAACWVLLAPESTLALLALAAAHVGETVAQSPFIPNHQLFAALVNITVIAGAVVLAPRARRFTIDRGDLYAAVAPAIRLAVLVLYFFAFFHKLNADWFDPEVSCGAVLYATVSERLPIFPVSVSWSVVVIYLSLAIEAAIPLLLVFRRTRHTGILVGLTFHWFLALHPFHGFYNFSAMLLAAFSLFVAPERIADAADRLGRPRFVAISRGTACLFAICWLAQWAGLNLPEAGVDPFQWFWMVYGLTATATFALVFYRRRAGSSGVSFFAVPQPVLVLLPFAVVLNGFTPYVGLKTETAWAMFSNLRTEGGVSNHLIVPATVQVFDFQRDLVQVTRSSDPNLRAMANRRQLLPYFEIRRRSDEGVAYVRNGVAYSYNRIADDPDFAGGVPFLQSKLLRFRPVDYTKQSCVH
jgi:hypothetical protein